MQRPRVRSYPSKNRGACMLLTLGSMALGVSSCSGAGTPSVGSTPSLEVVAVAPGIQMIAGAGGNITAFGGPDGLLLVDSGLPEEALRLQSKLEELGIGPPKRIVNTHFHYDHTGGNERFHATATIVSMASVRARLQAEQTLWKKQHPPVSPQSLPDVTFESELHLHFNGEDVRVVPAPHGHTDGDAVVFFPRAKVASLGDLYFAGMYPIFHPEHGGGLRSYLKNLEWVLTQLPSGTRVIPGHGPLADREELVRYVVMIRACLDTVEAGMKLKKSLQELQEAGLPPEWEPYSHGYRNTRQWIEAIHQSLQAALPR